MVFNFTTFIFELINFGVLLLILHRLLYRPLKRGIEGRHQALADRELEAAKALEATQELNQSLQEERNQNDLLRERVLREANEQAAEERSRLLTRAREDAAVEWTRVERLLETERKAALVWVREAAIEESIALASRLLMSMAPAAIHDVLRESLVESLEQHASRLGEDGVNAVEVTGATIPGAEELEPITRALTRALGSAPRLSLQEDESLGAGYLLRIGDRVFDASVRGQFATLRDRARHLIGQGEALAHV